MNNMHNLLYKTWAAGLRRRRRSRLLLKTLQDRPILPSGWPPNDKTATVLMTAKMWSWVPEVLTGNMEWLIDDQLQSNSDLVTVICIWYTGRKQPTKQRKMERWKNVYCSV